MDSKVGKENEEIDTSCKILVLPECVLRVLFSYLDATSLFLLTRTCRYFKYFVEDPTFWKYIDARAEPDSNEKVQYCCDRIHKRTSHVFFRAKDKVCGRVPENFFENINPFVNLRVLALENQRFSGNKILLKHFPTCLEELSLKKTHIKSSDNFFQHSDKAMQKLKVLILDGCKWVTCSFLMSVAKYDNLEIISVVKCLLLHLNMVPYLNVARFGCKKLKLFDCRFTGIGHELLCYFYPKCLSFQCLYFQGLKSGELDYNEKIFTSSCMRAVPYPTDNNAMDGNVCDESLSKYISFIGTDALEPMPDSVLYRDPYQKCTCGYTGQEKETGLPDPKLTEDYVVYEPPRRQMMKFVCRKHVVDVQVLPGEFRDFFMANQQQFFTDINSDVDSDPDSSDSDNDNACCMYGMGRRMVLLTPGNNPDDVQERVFEINHDDNRENNNISIFIASRLGDRGSSLPREARENNSNPVPSTSRSVSENGINENIENSRNEAKRKHSETQDHSEAQDPSEKESKRARVSGENAVSDEIQEAQVNELVESATDMRNRLNQFLKKSLDNLRPARVPREESQPSTSRVRIRDPAEYGGNDFRRTWARARSMPNNICVIIPSASEPSIQIQNDERLPDLPAAENTIRVNISQHFERRIHGIIRGPDISRIINPIIAHVNYKYDKKKLCLHRLSLRGFKKITDLALDYIKNLKIDLIDLTYTSVTREGIEGFLVHNPNCRVVHPLYCVCKPISPF